MEGKKTNNPMIVTFYLILLVNHISEGKNLVIFLEINGFTCIFQKLQDMDYMLESQSYVRSFLYSIKGKTTAKSGLIIIKLSNGNVSSRYVYLFLEFHNLAALFVQTSSA